MPRFDSDAGYPPSAALYWPNGHGYAMPPRLMKQAGCKHATCRSVTPSRRRGGWGEPGSIKRTIYGSHYSPAPGFPWRGITKLGAGFVRVCLCLLCLALPCFAADALDAWRTQVARTRILAENNVQRAYAEAVRLRAALPVDATPADNIRVINLQARTEIYLAQTDLAARSIELAAKLAKEFADPVGQVEADLNLSLNAVYQANIPALIAATTHSMTMIDGIDRPELLSEAMLWAAMMYRRIGQIDESISMAMQGMEIAKRSGNPLALTFAEHGMAISFEQSGHHAKAREHYLNMRAQARFARSMLLEAYALVGLGNVAPMLGNAQQGEALNREAVAVFREVGSPFSLAFGMFALAEKLRAQKRHPEAQALYDEVLAIYMRYPSKIGHWYTLHARSANYLAMGERQSALADAEQAYVLAKDIGAPFYVTESAKLCGMLAARRQDFERAYAYSLEASEMAAKSAQEKASTRMMELAKRYESESKQRQIDELNRHNLQQRAELAQRALQQRWLWTVLIGSFITLLGAIYLVFRLRCSQSDLGKQTRTLQSILDSMGEGVAVIDAHGKLLLLNPAGKKIAGFYLTSTNTRLSPKQFDFYLPDQKTPYPYSDLPLVRAVRGEACDNVEIFMNHPTLAEGRWLNVTTRPLTNDAGAIIGGVAVFSDITLSKQAESLLKNSEQKFRTLAENSPDIIVRYDRECRCLYVNPTYAREVGWSFDEALSLTLEARWRGVNISTRDYRATLLRVMETATPVELMVEWQRPNDGQLSVYAFHIVAEWDDSGNVVGALGMGHNITALKLAEQQREESFALLRNLESRRESVREEERKRIAREIHDELGQQLTAMRMRIAVLRLQFGAGNPELVKQVADMQALIDNTIQTVRSVASSLRPAALDMGLTAALDWLVAEFQRNAGIPCKLHKPAREVRLEDERATEVFRIVQESLTNVARHAHASQVDVIIAYNGSECLIEIRDDGFGFNPTDTRQSALGLVGMKERGYVLRGEVTVNSTPGAGTSVQMLLPLHEERLVT